MARVIKPLVLRHIKGEVAKIERNSGGLNPKQLLSIWNGASGIALDEGGVAVGFAIYNEDKKRIIVQVMKAPDQSGYAMIGEHLKGLLLPAIRKLGPSRIGFALDPVKSNYEECANGLADAGWEIVTGPFDSEQNEEFKSEIRAIFTTEVPLGVQYTQEYIRGETELEFLDDDIGN